MTLAQLLPDSQDVLVATPQPVAQKVARRTADMTDKFKLEIIGEVENMSDYMTQSEEGFGIFGEGGGRLLSDELDVPLLGRVPLTMTFRQNSDEGIPLVLADPDDPASQANRQISHGLIALAPAAPLPMLDELPMTPPEPPPAAGMSLPMA